MHHDAPDEKRAPTPKTERPALTTSSLEEPLEDAESGLSAGDDDDKGPGGVLADIDDEER